MPVKKGKKPRPSSSDRKADHLLLSRQSAMQLGRNYFDDLTLEHQALPEIDLAAVDVSTEFLDRKLRAPLLISSMTGGTKEARRINRNLARAAQAAGIALALGSQRSAIENPKLASTFKVRDLAPDIPLLANLGAVQLNYGFGLAECQRAVEMIEADALVFHLNPLQEAIQPEGQTDFSGLATKIGDIALHLSVPVVVKEIGGGLSLESARRLIDHGVRILDCAGLGGTSWSRIEGARAEDPDLGELFADWGIPTPKSIAQLSTLKGITLIASGGVRSGLDVAKSIALGADLAALAQPFLLAADQSWQSATKLAERIVRELEITMFCSGARDLKALRDRHLAERSSRPL